MTSAENNGIDYNKEFCKLLNSKSEYAKQIINIDLNFPITYVINYQDIKQISPILADLIINSPKETLYKLKLEIIDDVLNQKYLPDIFPELKKKDEIFVCSKDFETQQKTLSAGEKKFEYDKLITTPKTKFYENISRFHIMIYNLDKVLDVNEITAEYSNKLIAVRGVINDISDLKGKYVKPVYVHREENDYHKTNVTFVYPHGELDEPIDLELEDFIEKPTRCPICGKPGNIRLSPEESIIVDRREIRLMQRLNASNINKKEDEVKVILEDNLVKLADRLGIGDEIIVTGILVPETGKNGEVSGWHIHAIHFQIVDNRPKLTEEEKKKLEEIAREYERKPSENGFDKLLTIIAHSIVPYVELPIEDKLKLVLAIVKGVTLRKGGELIKRGSIHIGIVGDPATAKTSTVSGLEPIVPGGKMVYVNGPVSTTAGLQGAVTRNEKTGGFEIKPGAILRANDGIVAIDEADKMPKEILNSLLEIMEKEVITITKAKSGKFEDRASFIVIANPKLERFDPNTPRYQQINFSDPFLSRVDLWIVRIDDQKDDEKIAKRIAYADFFSSSHKREQMQLSDFDAIETEYWDDDFLKRYLTYAETFAPTLSRETREMITKYFLKLRKLNDSYPNSPISITYRQEQTLIRTSEAIAKLHLRDTVTVKDVEYAIKIYEHSLQSLGFDTRAWNVDIDLLETGIPGGSRLYIQKMLEIIDSLSQGRGCAKLREIYNIAEEQLQMRKEEIDNLLKKMREKRLINEAKPDCYSKQ